MLSIYLVGTLHGGLTPHTELQTILEELKPQQVFVELTDKEVLSLVEGKSLFRDEMVFIYNWARKYGVEVVNYDIENDILKPGVNGSEPEFRRLVGEQKKILDQFSWKDLNKSENWDISEDFQELDVQLHKLFLDKDKGVIREQGMFERINKSILEEGIVVVFCGTGHLQFFKENLADSIIYFESTD